MTSLNIPNNVKSLGNGVCSKCTSLTSFTISDNITSIGSSAFYGCTALTSITIPGSITSIGERAFYGCTALTSITIPNSITSIGERAFYGCTGLTSIKIPNSVEKLGVCAFQNCSNLTDFYFYADKSILDKNIFGNFNYAICAITLYVPKADVSYYQSTSPGMLFRKVVGVSAGSTPDVKQCAKPTVCFEDGKLYFDCATDGAEFVSTVSTPQTGEMHESVLDLGVAYYITVYAKKPGFKDSEMVKAKLLWTGMVLDVEDGEASGLSKRHKADVNSDGDVNISDIVSVINVMAGN